MLVVPKNKRKSENKKQIQNIQSNSKNNDADLEMLNTLKQELDAITTESINGIILISKAHYVGNNEQKKQ